MKVCVIGDANTVTGFRLGGLGECYEVTHRIEALDVFRDLARDAEVGLIIITEKIADEIRDEIPALIRDKVTPVVVEIPDKEGHLETKVDPIRELIKQAVGVEIKYE